ncbi:venom carboxylesterase-6-like [Copidosoma floridanum]|uniref:venom carboxylesterase-6-like n=1 Tax=Copidosoma floridanum TaxID=29053 RepID=UPI0006C95344|nr:venom carboxylesterase-6-like [Copidosoma floridanum]
MFSLLVPVLLSIVGCASTEPKAPIVHTPLGVVRGTYKLSENGRWYAAYEGVPYAEPPEGDLRFRDPVPVKPWPGTLMATEKRSVCAQYVDVPPGKDGQPVAEGQIQGEDDCLHLNIYAPVLPRKKNMPVIFFIHGGAFQYASANYFGDKYLADRDVVFAAVNYRLGIMGFLSTEDASLPGNYGLKDQALALRWISRYIGYFGGDPSRVIVVGFSAGSSSVQYHYLMPQSRGLFHGSIGMSGTSVNPWGFSARGSAEKAKKLGAIFDCPTHNSAWMVECLRRVPAHELVAAEKHFQPWQYNPMAPFAPVVDGVYVTKSPKEAFEARELYDVPAIYGFTSDEGCYPAAAYAPHGNLLRELNDNWTKIAPHLMQYNYTLPQKMHEVVAKDARREYFGGASINKKSALKLIEMLSDQQFLVGIEAGVRLQAQASRSPVYLYEYAFRGSQSYSDHLSRTTNDYGVCHADDMNLIVENPNVDPTKTKAEWKMSNFLMDLVEYVAYHGVPHAGLNWKPVDATNPELKYLRIYKPGRYKMTGSTNLGNKRFWKKYFFTA